MQSRTKTYIVSALCPFLWAFQLCAVGVDAQGFDVVIRNGMIYDGAGGEPFTGDLGIKGDRIRVIGNIEDAAAAKIIDARGLAVSPGFINMLSHAPANLMIDGHSHSDIRQGVTLEVFGEVSLGPLSAEQKAERERRQGDIKYRIPWTTLGEAMEFLERRGIAPNIASFVSATTIRINALGYEDRAPSDGELEEMRQQVRESMEEGALGVTSSLIYAPAFFAKTDELIALCKVAAEYGGMYISHMRSEGNKLLEALDELITIAREAGLPAEVYHLKAAGRKNWHKLEPLIEKIEAARAAGIRITADMYTYTAGATGLDASMPPWVQEGGYRQWTRRLMDPAIRKTVAKEMNAEGDDWENLYFAAGSPENLLLIGFKNPDLKYLIGKTLAEAAELRGTSPEETAMDLVIEDGSRVSTVYFLMSESNVKKQIALPWLSFGSDAGSMAPKGVFIKSSTHPRAYGNVARLLGKYVREEKIITLQEAIRKLTALPAENLKLRERGRLKEGYYADVVVFDPRKVQDHATFEKPHHYSTGVVHVFVNGVQVLEDGEHTGAMPGRFVRGPGWTRKEAA